MLSKVLWIIYYNFKIMVIGYWDVQIDIKAAIEKKGFKAVPLDWFSNHWHKDFSKSNCDSFIWYPHALHSQWEKLFERSFFIENVLKSKCFPGSKTAYFFQDKIRQKYFFDILSIPTPKTEIIKSRESFTTFLNETKFPFLIKDIWGYGGYNIKIIKNKEDALNLVDRKELSPINTRRSRGDYIYTQEIIDIECEYRVITVGQKIIFSYKKKSDNFLKHVWRGAKVSLDVENEILINVDKWNKQMKLDFCGWDLARDRLGNIYLLEINPIFGTKILEENNINLADHLLGLIN
jgi:glutathione synthase/RimK-type ligase-like ATP-grasp enzyme